MELALMMPYRPGSSGVLTAAAFAVLLLTGCPPTYPKCESDANCKEKGEVCVQGMCQECGTDANCKAGFVCEANRCVPKPQCLDDGACGPGQKCTNRTCVAKAECTADENCPSGQGCTAGKCVSLPPPPVSCTFEPVRFQFNEFNLSAGAQGALARSADCIKKASLRFTLEGHADERGTEEYNMVLSQKRAASVRKYLVDLGVGASALDTVGYGENKPAVSGHDEAAWSANRRVEFKQR
jgi:peptidoglycan-associated lipoprotein